MARPAVSPMTRFIRQVEWSDNRYDGTRCLLWTGSGTGNGYGRFAFATVDSRPLRAPAHRWLYERWVGPVPEGLVMDHLCRVRRCVNPLHLEPVTVQANVLRGEGPTAVAARRLTCKYGHPYDRSVVWAGIPRRVCSICRKAAG